MKGIVIYNSQTGFTKQYAQWISEASGFECVEFTVGSKMNLSDFDTILFGGWCMAGNVTKLNWLKEKLSDFNKAGKKVIVFAVGASPADYSEVPVAMDRLFSSEEKQMVKVFYCPGGISYGRMKLPSRFAMKMFSKALMNKKDATEDEKRQGEMISKDYSLLDKKYITPILEAIGK